jgi:hypothetical protein
MPNQTLSTTPGLSVGVQPVETSTGTPTVRHLPSPLQLALLINIDQCWVAVFFDAFVDGTFRLMYSTTIDLVGPWSTEQDLYQTVAEPGSYNYAGHAYPDLGNGNSLLLSWTYGNNLTKMAEVTFA